MDLTALLPSFGGLVWTAIAFVLALSIIVFVHEFGHYIVGRWSGIKADVFSIGFGPVLFGRTDRRGTYWQIAALPFGGYVKFKGDADPASVTRAPETAPGGTNEKLLRQEMRSTMHGAPLWARAATVAAGPVFNFILSILVFAAVILYQGTPREPATIRALVPLPAEVQGLEAGDEILSVGGRDVSTLGGIYEVAAQLDTDGATTPYTVRRNGAETEVEGPFPFPPVVSTVQPQSAAWDAGLKPGDVIVSADGTPISSFRDLQKIVTVSKGAELDLGIWRAGETFTAALAPRSVDMPVTGGGFETRWLLGLTGSLAFEPVTVTPSPFTAIGQGAEQTLFIVRSSLSGLWHMVTGAISSCNLRGPLGIAETSGAAASQGPSTFIWFIAVLSTAVGLLNLFPIPVLDGGHLVFYAYEAVARRPPSDRALRILMAGGMALMLALMIFALTNDLFCP
ncbi:RIP metalloprotease RseP [Tropicimonas sp. IMCC34011]|uniref:RIP metalloprotease RseP n=1 Tax=Tropicimonas sp. IMCC34011 TaxID=2248759 RepID=UPI000E2648E1|nr:RIP metalloprotease RseP [Tropicimonas sp. IMCC34011]